MIKCCHQSPRENGDYYCRMRGFFVDDERCTKCAILGEDNKECIEPQPPDIFERAANAAKAAGRVAAAAVSGKPITVSDEVYAERLSICEACEFLRKSDKVCTAAGCGCYVVGTAITPGKARLATENCPKGKWPKPEVD